MTYRKSDPFFMAGHPSRVLISYEIITFIVYPLFVIASTNIYQFFRIIMQKIYSASIYPSETTRASIPTVLLNRYTVLQKQSGAETRHYEGKITPIREDTRPSPTVKSKPTMLDLFSERHRGRSLQYLFGPIESSPTKLKTVLFAFNHFDGFFQLKIFYAVFHGF